MKQIIVVPCYNEEVRFPYQDYADFISKNESFFIFVNDGSTDKTQKTLLRLKERFPDKVEVIEEKENQGKSEAVRIGIRHGVSNFECDLIGFMDADLSTKLEEVYHFQEIFKSKKEILFVFGSRIAKIGSEIKRYYWRHYIGRVMATIFSSYLNIMVYDTQCGAKFFRPRLAEVIFKEKFLSRWLFDIEIFKRMEFSGFGIEDYSIELPLTSWIEQGGSKISLKDMFKFPIEYFRIVRHYRQTLSQSF